MTKRGFRFCLLCVVVSLVYYCVLAFVRFPFISAIQSDWLGRTSLTLPT